MWIIADRINGTWQASPVVLRRFQSEGAAREMLRQLAVWYHDGVAGVSTEARVVEAANTLGGVGELLARLNADAEPRAVECLADIGKPGYSRG